MARLQMAHEAMFKKPLKPIFFDPRFDVIAERQNILRCLTLRQIINQRALKNQRVRRIADDQPCNPFGCLQRRRPTNRPAPVMRRQRKPVQAKRIGKRKQISDHFVRRIITHFRRFG